MLAALLAARNEVDSGEALFWIGVLVVVVCIAAALYCIVQLNNWIGALVCLVIAIVAAVLLI